MVAEGISENILRPGEESVLQWKLRDFKYTDKGIESSGADGNYITQQTCFQATRVLEEQLKENNIFKNTLEVLQNNFPTLSDHARHLELFTGKVLAIYFSGQKEPDLAQTEKTLSQFTNDLLGGPVMFGAKVELQGVTLQSEKIEIGPNISIRQPQKEDLEVPLHSFGFRQHFLIYPSAFLNIEFLSARSQQDQIQPRMEQYIALLRLFNVGSVRWTTCKRYSDSIIDTMAHGTLGSGVPGFALETYVIRHEDESKLKTFWQVMGNIIPKDLYDFQKQTNHLTVAYDRFSDALMQNGIMERRIANAVMGLEALYLEENQELSYRLGLRISKTLSLLGKNPLEVREIIKDAYNTRSTFAHGGHLSYNKKKTLDSKYRGIKNLLLPLLDYLRISIVMMIKCNIGKEHFIDLMDEALIDPQKNAELESLLASVRLIV